MTGLVLFLCLAQAPTPLAVMVSSKRPGADAIATSAAGRVHTALLREGVAAEGLLDDAAAVKKVRVADARKCQGGASCLSKVAVLLGPNAVVIGVDVGKIGTLLAVRLEAVSAKTGQSLLLTDVTAPVEGWGDKLAVPIALFARQLVEKLAALAQNPAPEPVPPPAPVVATPRPPDAPVLVATTPPPPPPAVELKPTRPAALKWTFGVGALTGAAVSVGFLIAGLNTRAEFLGKNTTVDGLMATGHTADTAARLAATSNTQLTISLVAGLTAALLSAVATWLFLTE